MWTRERLAAQIRVDAFNAFNRVNLNNPSLLINDKIAPGQTIDRMLAITFKAPRKGQKLVHQCIAGVVAQKGVAALGDHHRVDQFNRFPGCLRGYFLQGN